MIRPEKIFTLTSAGIVSALGYTPANKAGDTFTGNVAVSANTAGNALTVTQIGAGNCLVVEDSASTDSTAFVINPSGVVIVQGTTSIGTGLIQCSSTAGNTPNFQGYQWSTDTNSCDIVLTKSRSASSGTFTSVNLNDNLGRIVFQGSFTSNAYNAASVIGICDAAVGSGSMPGRLTFNTTASGSTTPVERVRIDSAGNVGIGGTASSGVRLDVTGGSTRVTSLRAAVRTVTASSVTADTADFLIRCDCTSNAITVNLPAASTSTGLIYSIKKIDAVANNVTIDANASELIDGVTTKTISSQYARFYIMCDGTVWNVID